MKGIKIISLILLFCTTCFVQAQITPGFTVTTRTVCAVTSLQFTDTTKVTNDSITAWMWSFGDGDTSVIQHPAHIFSSEGIYSVILRVTNAASQSFTVTKNAYITVLTQPDAGFTYDDSLFSSFLSVYFVADEAYSPLSTYLWNFGDNLTSDTTSLIHHYSAPGNYTVNFTVTSGTCTATNSKSITVFDGFKAPNIFTPNGDGVNDYFYVNTNGTTIYNLYIYNQWGIAVYYFSGKKVIWDGHTAAGAEVPNGIYYYILSAAGGDAQYEKTGFVQLIK